MATERGNITCKLGLVQVTASGRNVTITREAVLRLVLSPKAPEEHALFTADHYHLIEVYIDGSRKTHWDVEQHLEQHPFWDQTLRHFSSPSTASEGSRYIQLELPPPTDSVGPPQQSLPSNLSSICLHFGTSLDLHKAIKWFKDAGFIHHDESQASYVGPSNGSQGNAIQSRRVRTLSHSLAPLSSSQHSARPPSRPQSQAQARDYQMAAPRRHQSVVPLHPMQVPRYPRINPPSNGIRSPSSSGFNRPPSSSQPTRPPTSSQGYVPLSTRTSAGRESPVPSMSQAIRQGAVRSVSRQMVSGSVRNPNIPRIGRDRMYSDAVSRSKPDGYSGISTHRRRQPLVASGIPAMGSAAAMSGLTSDWQSPTPSEGPSAFSFASPATPQLLSQGIWQDNTSQVTFQPTEEQQSAHVQRIEEPRSATVQPIEEPHSATIQPSSPATQLAPDRPADPQLASQSASAQLADLQQPSITLADLPRVTRILGAVSELEAGLLSEIRATDMTITSYAARLYCGIQQIFIDERGRE